MIASADDPLATIFVLQGPPGLINQPIQVTRTRMVLGRDPKSSDVTFYPGEPSSVSRVHAVLEYDQTRGFSITDKASANGTRVNGRRLTVETPQSMRDGDEVVLGDLAKRGVKLRFALGKGARWSGGNEDKTQIGI
jgi:pSer/pThr/pTyr-binding forkhead associated (FHA) protein